MSETRKNHLSIDGGQVKEEDQVSSYKPIPESDAEFRSAKSNLSKSREKVSDEAEEKLLQKEDEAKITTRVDMADAKYVVGDHRNGDAKIELDANKRQFSGLTKEELMKYADDPFWVRLRWFMFVLFWALWLCMLGGAIAIIVRAPKCAAPSPKTWFEVGPLVDASEVDYAEIEPELPLLAESQVQGIFVEPCEDSYEVLETTTCLDKFKAFVSKAKENSIKVIVDLTANFVSTNHTWFKQSEDRAPEFAEFFTWAKSNESDPETNRPKVPNNWVSTLDGPAWSWSEKRREYYLHQFAVQQADLNFHNAKVVKKFDDVIKKYMDAGAAGVRLHKARQLLVDPSLHNDSMAAGQRAPDATLDEYKFLWHKQTSDHAGLVDLIAHWAHLVESTSTEKTVFTLAEDGVLTPEWHLLRNGSSLRPPSTVPVSLDASVDVVLADITRRLEQWPALQLVSSDPLVKEESAALSILLPATPVLAHGQIQRDQNDTAPSQRFEHLAALRQDGSVQHGLTVVMTAPSNDAGHHMLACARWRVGHTGYLALFNPGETAHANLTGLVSSLPASAALHHFSQHVKEATNYTNNAVVQSEDVLVPAHSGVVLSYIPLTETEH